MKAVPIGMTFWRFSFDTMPMLLAATSECPKEALFSHFSHFWKPATSIDHGNASMALSEVDLNFVGKEWSLALLLPGAAHNHQVTETTCEAKSFMWFLDVVVFC